MNTYLVPLEKKNSRSSFLRFSIASFLAAVLLLSGCTAVSVSPEERSETAPSSLRMAAGQGVVALRVTSNRANISTFFGRWSRLRIQNLETSEKTWLSDRAELMAGYSLFAEVLPPGKYVIVGVDSAVSGMGTVVDSADASDRLPEFLVAAGQLTDLGTVAYVRKHYPINASQFHWGMVPESPLDREVLLQQFSPALLEQVNARPVLGWIDDDRLRARRAAYDASREASMRVASPVRLADGSMLFGESFGQIAVRSARGNWSFIQTPTALPIRALHAGGDGKIFAGSDDGILLVRRSTEGAWERIALPGDGASATVLHIGSLPGGTEILVVLQTSDRFLGLSIDAEGRQFKELFSKPRVLSANPMLDIRAHVFQAGNKLLFVTGAFQQPTEILRFSLADQRWDAVPAGEGGLLASWAMLGDGSIGRFAGIPLTGTYFMLSRDDGASWQRRGDLNWAGTGLLFVSEQVGYVIRLDSMAAFDPERVELSVWRTDDAGMTWSRAGSPKLVSGTLVALGGTEEIGYASLNGRFMVSADGGRTWRTERVLP